MWIVEHGRLVSPKKIELTYIRKDQLVALDTGGLCQSIEIFCPDTVQISNLPWKKFQTIETKNWVLTIIKLNGVARTLRKPIVFNDLATVEELYHQIVESDRDLGEADSNCQITTHDITSQSDGDKSFSSLKSDYPAQYT